MKTLYVASSWRNPYYTALINKLHTDGFHIWDWRNPPDTHGQPFRWQDVEPEYKHGDLVSTDAYRNWLIHPAAERGYKSDHTGMETCDIGVLLLPSGRSAHTEAGFIRGRGKPVFVMRPDDEEPDLMYKLYSGIFSEYGELLAALKAC